MEEHNPVCRVCQNIGSSDEPLYHPCKCSGTIRYVHQSCLETWLAHSRKKECEICAHQFDFVPLYSRNATKDVAFIFILKMSTLSLFKYTKRLLKILISFMVWVLLVPYCASWIWSFYFEYISVFKFLSAIPCALSKDTCRKFLEPLIRMHISSAKSASREAILPLMSILPEVFHDDIMGIYLQDASLSSKLFEVTKLDFSNGARSYILNVLRSRFSLGSISRDLIRGQIIAFTAFLSCMVLLFLQEYITLHTNDSCEENARSTTSAPRENRTTSQILNPELGHDIWNSFRPEENEEHYSSEINFIFSILGTKWSVKSLVINFFVANLLIATVIGGLFWIPYCLTEIVSFVLKLPYIPATKDLVLRSLHLVPVESLRIIVEKTLNCTIVSKILSFPTDLAYFVWLVIFKFKKTPLEDNSLNFDRPHVDEALSFLINNRKTSVPNFFFSESKDTIVYQLKSFWNNLSIGHLKYYGTSALVPLSNSDTRRGLLYIRLIRILSFLVYVLIKKGVILILLLFHIRRLGWLNQPYGNSIEVMFRKLSHTTKSTAEFLSIFALNVAILPIFYGIITDMLTLPAFGPTATLAKRWDFFMSYTWTSRLIHWLAGTALISIFVYYFSMVKSILRPGVIWFVKEPSYSQYVIIDHSGNSTFLLRLWRICISAIMYSLALIFCLGGFMSLIMHWDKYVTRFTKGGGITQILPLQWDLSDSPFKLPIDLILYHLLSIKILKTLKPGTTVNKYVNIWFRSVSKRLRLTHFFFGERSQDEESDTESLEDTENQSNENHTKYQTPNTFKKYKKWGMPSFRSRKRREYRFARVPNSNNVIGINESAFLPTKESQSINDLCGGDNNMALKWTKVYFPPNFKCRVFIMVILNWISGISVSAVFIIIPLMVGRYFLNYLFAFLGSKISPESAASMYIKVTSPSAPIISYFSKNTPNLPKDLDKMPFIYKAILLHMNVSLKGFQTLKINSDSFNSVSKKYLESSTPFGVNNYALLNRPLWNRGIRPDLAMHDTYSLFTGFYVCFILFKILSCTKRILSTCIRALLAALRKPKRRITRSPKLNTFRYLKKLGNIPKALIGILQLARRLLVFTFIVISVPIIIGMVFDAFVLRFIQSLLRLFIEVPVLSLATIPPSWMEERGKFELVSYVLANEWAFGQIVVNTVYLILQYGVRTETRYHFLQNFTLSSAMRNQGPLLKRIVFPSLILSIFLIELPSLIKIIILKIVLPWIACLKIIMFIIKSGNSSDLFSSILLKYLYEINSLDIKTEMRLETKSILFNMLPLVAISISSLLCLIFFAVRFAIRVTNFSIRRMKGVVYDQNFLIGRKLRNFEAHSGDLEG